MTEHKFTDDEIIKALWCISGKEEVFCRECAYVKIGGGFACKKSSAKDALDLINRQKAEIASLEDALLGELSASAAIAIKDMERNGKEMERAFKAEAVKEFAERLKKYYASLNGKTAAGCVEYHVDQIAKEMIGETK